MQIVSSYGVEVKKQNIPIRHTLDIFRKAVSYLIGVYAENWDSAPLQLFFWLCGIKAGVC